MFIISMLMSVGTNCTAVQQNFEPGGNKSRAFEKGRPEVSKSRNNGGG